MRKFTDIALQSRGAIAAAARTYNISGFARGSAERARGALLRILTLHGGGGEAAY